eukprot:CAMPEP_0197865194 /NCGR_PEP_ID=MMETSP1438-20131217/43522_1 /TAXON_ID=1461541 /ORGANISM="Pterosperma sp., Strain CCMP1384" /LENGTH=160 /DNA_ID=CAMNT_0043483619 /DNA_START=825 /DNA_END=1307 /DNA_ORIENTATION=-
MGNTSWQIVVHYMLPVPLVLVGLVAIPMPKALRKPSLALVDWCLNIKINDVPVVPILLFVSLTMFCGLCVETAKPFNKPDNLSPNQEMALRARKWRSERNFWISFFVLVLWLMLYRIRSIRKYILELEAKVEQLEGDKKVEKTEKKKEEPVKNPGEKKEE